MKCGDCKHWVDNGTDYCSCDRDALLRERNFFCAAWERKKPFERPTTNADKIRSMSDYDLADWIAEILTYHGGLYTQRDRFECDQECPLYKCCNDQPTDNIEGWLGLPADLPVMYYPQVPGITPTIISDKEGKG